MTTHPRTRPSSVTAYYQRRDMLAAYTALYGAMVA